ncbi:PadR family transcriptional regulator [Pseudomonas lalucatii]|uniref:PadR family transcriptional regulator n=1 Tax=Pseudomonas lalucatii TaxID=1424203 RepID=A0ABS5PY22_9PSED|nr:PadR family transcriptional regulator [Pseudomonas lalucatii]MBS7661401.1 PadR family transcriptional regulator [Pseudomonas lalucatii]MBS7724110.1 PadR family transcriptional regulator [Pseudomonas lalucatii]QVM87887.1 PadR family transcriptional regulator [Pseudomonas lalucatii]
MSLRHAILTLLETEPASGYDIIRHFKQSLGYFWNAKHQQVYQELRRLSDEGWLLCSEQAQSDKPDRKVYSISPSGRAELRRWLAEPAPPNKINDALLVKLYAGALAEPDNLRAELARHRATHRATLDSLQEIERQYLALEPQEQARQRLPYLTLRRGILGEQAWLAWAEEVEAELAARAGQPHAEPVGK